MRPGGNSLSLDWKTFQKMEPAITPTGRRHGQGDDLSTSARVAKMLAPTGEENVKNGHVHPQLYDYQRDAQSVFHPAEASLDREAGRPTVGGVFKEWWQGYLDALERDNGRFREQQAGRGADEGGVDLACDVCVTIAFGQAPRVEIGHRSSSDEMDGEAMKAMRFAVDNRPATEPLWPAGTREDRAAPMRACYRFSASARRLPPVMLPGCAFDEVKMKVGCVWPLKKIFKSDVKLVSAGPG